MKHHEHLYYSFDPASACMHESIVQTLPKMHRREVFHYKYPLSIHLNATTDRSVCAFPLMRSGIHSIALCVPIHVDTVRTKPKKWDLLLFAAGSCSHKEMCMRRWRPHTAICATIRSKFEFVQKRNADWCPLNAFCEEFQLNFFLLHRIVPNHRIAVQPVIAFTWFMASVHRIRLNGLCSMFVCALGSSVKERMFLSSFVFFSPLSRLLEWHITIRKLAASVIFNYVNRCRRWHAKTNTRRRKGMEHRSDETDLWHTRQTGNVDWHLLWHFLAPVRPPFAGKKRQKNML